MNRSGGVMLIAFRLISVPAFLVLGAVLVSPIAGVAAEGGAIEVQISRAAMGHLEERFSSNCQKQRSNAGGQVLVLDEECEKRALSQAIANDEDQSVSAVVKILVNAGVVLGKSETNRNYSQCYQQGWEWSKNVLEAVASSSIRTKTSVSQEQLKMTVDTINRLCNPQEAKRFITIAGSLNRTLEPIKAARLKEEGRLEEELRSNLLASAQAAKNQERIEKDKTQRKNDAVRAQQAEDQAQRDAQQREQAKIATAAEAERMKNPAYREAQQQRQQQEQIRNNCLSSSEKRMVECMTKNPMYANACAEAHRTNVRICNGVPQ